MRGFGWIGVFLVLFLTLVAGAIGYDLGVAHATDVAATGGSVVVHTGWFGGFPFFGLLFGLLLFGMVVSLIRRAAGGGPGWAHHRYAAGWGPQGSWAHGTWGPATPQTPTGTAPDGATPAGTADASGPARPAQPTPQAQPPMPQAQPPMPQAQPPMPQAPYAPGAYGAPPAYGTPGYPPPGTYGAQPYGQPAPWGQPSWPGPQHDPRPPAGSGQPG